MDFMEFLNNYTLPVVLGICLCVGYIVKQWLADIDNKYIPAIVAVLGVFLSVWVNRWSVTPEIILTGLVSGLGSTGMHQIFKQFIEST
ncbi:MAG: holin [Lachnospiraceae bacterium]|nr:holin [Lachnospiraceae bacterium]